MTVSAHRGEIFYLSDDPLKDEAAIVHHPDGLLVVEDGYIRDCGPFKDLAESLDTDMSPIRHENGIIVPGFVDAHVHFPQLEMIASPGKKLMEWLEHYTFPAEEAFADKDKVRAAAPAFLDQLLNHGTTSALIFGSVHAHSVDVLFEAALDRQMRLIAGKVMMDRDAPDALLEDAKTAYAQCQALIQRWHGKGRLGYAVTPRFAPTCSSECLDMAAKLMAENPDVLLQTHLAENEDEIARVAELFPDAEDYLDVYDRHGLVSDRSVFAHCIHMSDQAQMRLKQADARVAFCPTSNMFLGSGLMEYANLRQKGVKIALGTDVGAGTSLSLLETMAEAYKITHVKGTVLDVFQAFYHATLGGAKALHLDDKIGSLRPGHEADFLVLDYAPTDLIAQRIEQCKTLEERLFVLMMLGDDRAVRHTFVAGRQRK